MNTVSPTIDFHFFVCTNVKGSGEDCGSKGGQQILDELKSWARSQKFTKKIRINKAGCLGRCEEGVVAVGYPAGEWIVNASTNDLEEMKKFIQERMQ